MQKTKVSIERQINERLYQFIVPYESDYNEVISILDDIRKSLVEQHQLALKKLEEQKSEGIKNDT